MSRQGSEGTWVVRVLEFGFGFEFRVKWISESGLYLEPGAAALHQQQLQVLTGLRVFASLQGLVDPVGQLPSTRSKLHEAPPPSQQPQLLQVT